MSHEVKVKSAVNLRNKALITPASLQEIEAEVGGYRAPPRSGFAEFSLLHQHVSKCHSHILPEPSAILFLTAARVSPDIFWNWPLQGYPPSAKVWKAECSSHSCTWTWRGRSQRAWNLLLAPRGARADFSVLQTMEWEDFVSVRLHQLDFNETARGAQVPEGQWAVIEALVRPGSRESLTWRLLCCSVLLRHRYCISLCKPYGCTPPPSLAFLKVSGELSPLFLCRLMRSQVLPVQLMQQQALRTDYYEWKVRLPEAVATMANLKTKGPKNNCLSIYICLFPTT